MSEHPYTILATSSLPFDRIGKIPDHVIVEVEPFIRISERTGESLKSKILALGSEKITAVFTSAHAVNITAGLLKTKPAWDIYCIRNETRVAVINWFGTDSIRQFASNALRLSQQILADGVKNAVFFCGDQRMDVLPDYLVKYNIELTELIVYDTQMTPVQLQKHPDAILFFSPTAVRSFFSMNELSPRTAVYAMGQTTAKALKSITNQPIIISPEADKTFVFKMALSQAGSNSIT